MVDCRSKAMKWSMLFGSQPRMIDISSRSREVQVLVQDGYGLMIGNSARIQANGKIGSRLEIDTPGNNTRRYLSIYTSF